MFDVLFRSGNININIQVWQYYILPEEEQRMPGVKNPMCSAFPRVGEQTSVINTPGSLLLRSPVKYCLSMWVFFHYWFIEILDFSFSFHIIDKSANKLRESQVESYYCLLTLELSIQYTSHYFISNILWQLTRSDTLAEPFHHWGIQAIAETVRWPCHYIKSMRYNLYLSVLFS